MPFTATFIVLSICGIIDAGYLFYQHRKKTPLVCPLNHSCSVVTESKWSGVLGVRNEILGLLFYIFTLAMVLGSVIIPNLAATIYLILFISLSAALLFSIILTLIQLYKIKNYCFYCLISALLTFLLFINSAYLLFGGWQNHL